MVRVARHADGPDRCPVPVIAPIPQQQHYSREREPDRQDGQRSAAGQQGDHEREEPRDGQNRDRAHCDSLLPRHRSGPDAGPARVFAHSDGPFPAAPELATNSLEYARGAHVLYTAAPT